MKSASQSAVDALDADTSAEATSTRGSKRSRRWLVLPWHRELTLLASLSPYVKPSYLWGILSCAIAIIATQLVLPLLLQAVVDQGIIPADYPKIIWFSGWFFGIIVVSVGLRSLQGVLTTILVQHIIKHFRDQLIRHVLWQKPAYHDGQMSGNLLTRATSDFDNITEYLNHGVLRAIIDLFVVAGSLGALLLLHPVLLGIGLVGFGLCVAMIRVVSARTRSQSYKARRELSLLNGHTQECLYQHLAIKLYGGEAEQCAKHTQFVDKFRRAQMKVVSYDALLYSMIEGLMAIIIGLSFWWIATNLLGAAAISPGVMVAFIRVVQQIFDPLKELGSTMSMLQGMFTNLERIHELLDVDAALEGTEPWQPISPVSFIRFRGVNFRYEAPATAPERPGSAARPWTLADISFDIPPGSATAIVGETGSGKSTLMKLLTKNYDGYAGSITIGGQEVRRIHQAALRQHVALVSQELTLFAGTMAWNIHLGREGMSRQDAIKAAQMTGIHEFITSLDHGYDERVLESGINLSHGQKQLISLARALCHDPDILILDEATSAIDPVTEAALKHVFTTVIQHKTRVIIAHKLATIQGCDQIIVMDQGRLVERGNHAELMALNGHYSRLIQARNQLEAQGASQQMRPE